VAWRRSNTSRTAIEPSPIAVAARLTDPRQLYAYAELLLLQGRACRQFLSGQARGKTQVILDPG
jgi:hypothetical protein